MVLSDGYYKAPKNVPKTFLTWRKPIFQEKIPCFKTCLFVCIDYSPVLNGLKPSQAQYDRIAKYTQVMTNS